MTEEERAALYRQQAVNRENARQANERALAGSSEARKALADAWEPVVLAVQEARTGIEFCDPLDVR